MVVNSGVENVCDRVSISGLKETLVEGLCSALKPVELAISLSQMAVKTPLILAVQVYPKRLPYPALFVLGSHGFWGKIA